MSGATEEALILESAEILGRRVGLRLDPSIGGRLARCIHREASGRGIELYAYVGQLASDPSLVQQLLDLVTVQETSFFRDAEQFQVLARHVLAGRDQPVTLWSAGCSNGQEAYSLAMTLEESILANWRVVASDISRPALERTSRAIYSGREMAGVTPERRERHFERDGDLYEVRSSLRDRVTVVHHNLVTQPPPFERGTLDIAFCRNVLIYIGRKEVLGFLARTREWLAPDGWLFLGFSESLWHTTDLFRLVRLERSFVYRPGDDTAAGAVLKEPARRALPATRARERAPHSPGVGSAGRQLPLVSGVDEVDGAERIAELLALGAVAMTAGHFLAAISTYRKCTYLDPDLPIPHLHLGLALEGAGEGSAARRAFAASRAAMGRSDVSLLESMLEGYTIGELGRLLDTKLAPNKR